VSEEILINVTPQETRVVVVENGVLQGEPERSRMHLTCIRARERPATGKAEFSRKPCGLSRRRTAMPWMAWPGLASEAGREALQGWAGVSCDADVAPWMAGTVMPKSGRE